MPRRYVNLFVGSLAMLLVVAFVPRRLEANHSWGGYHWDGDSLPVGLDVGDNLSGAWLDLNADGRTYLDQAVLDWNSPTGGAIPSVELARGDGGTDPVSCDPNVGRIEVCNADYGSNGWLGLAQVWAYRGKDKHIAQATTLLNDYYFAMQGYDTWAWRQMVVCQEIAHDFGLDHQDESFYNYNLGTCMDYTAVPEGGGGYGPANTKPNQHDYDELEIIYAHIGGSGGGGGKKSGGGGGGGGGGRGKNKSDAFPDLPGQALQRVPIDSPAAWGQLIRDNGRAALYELDLGNGVSLFTFVTWAF